MLNKNLVSLLHFLYISKIVIFVNNLSELTLLLFDNKHVIQFFLIFPIQKYDEQFLLFVFFYFSCIRIRIFFYIRKHCFFYIKRFFVLDFPVLHLLWKFYVLKRWITLWNVFSFGILQERNLFTFFFTL